MLSRQGKNYEGSILKAAPSHPSIIALVELSLMFLPCNRASLSTTGCLLGAWQAGDASSGAGRCFFVIFSNVFSSRLMDGSQKLGHPTEKKSIPNR